MCMLVPSLSSIHRMSIRSVAGCLPHFKKVTFNLIFFVFYIVGKLKDQGVLIQNNKYIYNKVVRKEKVPNIFLVNYLY